MAEITFKPEFDWKRVAWGEPKEPRSERCSYCGEAIAEDTVPLMMFTEDGHCAQFCDACVHRFIDLEAES